MRKNLMTLMLGSSVNVVAAGFMPWTDVFSRFDANADGGVSPAVATDRKPAESFVGFQPYRVDHFAELDANGDGVVMQDALGRRDTLAPRHQPRVCAGLDVCGAVRRGSDRARLTPGAIGRSTVTEVGPAVTSGRPAHPQA